tara:strand:- start:176 stop:409 length:234 start_codon:yes stop_codon:yes gene_type:complete
MQFENKLSSKNKLIYFCLGNWGAGEVHKPALYIFIEHPLKSLPRGLTVYTKHLLKSYGSNDEVNSGYYLKAGSVKLT